MGTKPTIHIPYQGKQITISEAQKILKEEYGIHLSLDSLYDRYHNGKDIFAPKKVGKPEHTNIKYKGKEYTIKELQQKYLELHGEPINYFALYDRYRIGNIDLMAPVQKTTPPNTRFATYKGEKLNFQQAWAKEQEINPNASFIAFKGKFYRGEAFKKTRPYNKKKQKS